jgi:prepilin-type N-terminal cleavage/methylation domain-containing protein/prepilin-type processing-associated H-X9-DG protein
MNRREKRIRRGRPASGGAKGLFTLIIHHRLSFINSDGFTLIELLVVVSVVAVLMAILLPALSRVRKQAQGMVCQSNLRQWGTFMATSVTDNDGQFFSPNWEKSRGVCGPLTFTLEASAWGLWNLAEREQGEGIVCCPMASKFASSDGAGYKRGGTFTAWNFGTNEYVEWAPYGCGVSYSSYGLNNAVGWVWRLGEKEATEKHIWRTADVRGQNRIPVLLDSAAHWCISYWDSAGPSPPECDAIPTMSVRASPLANPECINRHDGGVNVLFMDWSVRKVGLKELWTLQWNRLYSTSGSWTKAGGAEPDDWPQWMRTFKDY